MEVEDNPVPEKRTEKKCYKKLKTEVVSSLKMTEERIGGGQGWWWSAVSMLETPERMRLLITREHAGESPNLSKPL